MPQANADKKEWAYGFHGVTRLAACHRSNLFLSVVR